MCWVYYRRVWIGNRIYWTLPWLYFTTYHPRLMCLAAVFTAMLGSGFQRRTFPFLRVPELSPASATSFSLRSTGTLNWLPAWRLSLSLSNQSQSHVTTDGQSVSMSWCHVRFGTCDQILFSVCKLLCCLCGAPSLTRGRACLLSAAVSSI
jgi:hypothetical protein